MAGKKTGPVTPSGPHGNGRGPMKYLGKTKVSCKGAAEPLFRPSVRGGSGKALNLLLLVCPRTAPGMLWYMLWALWRRSLARLRDRVHDLLNAAVMCAAQFMRAAARGSGDPGLVADSRPASDLTTSNSISNNQLPITKLSFD